MSVLQAIVLGLVQGLTEFLPISSSGHLLIVPAMLGWDDPGAAFTAVIQLGTMAAVLIYFRARPAGGSPRLAARSCGSRSRQRSTEANLGWFIILGTIPISIFGFVFSDQIESGAREPLPDRHDADRVLVRDARRRAIRRPAARPLEEIDGRDGLFIGIAQALALIPGVSRSGATISAGLFRDFDRTAAARYSFLLSVPAVVLSGLFELARHRRRGQRRVRRRPRSRRSSPSSPAMPRSPGCCAISRTTRSRCSSPTGSPSGILVIALAASGAIS